MPSLAKLIRTRGLRRVFIRVSPECWHPACRRLLSAFDLSVPNVESECPKHTRDLILLLRLTPRFLKGSIHGKAHRIER